MEKTKRKNVVQVLGFTDRDADNGLLLRALSYVNRKDAIILETEWPWLTKLAADEASEASEAAEARLINSLNSPRNGETMNL
jgi:hypothetical protein